MSRLPSARPPARLAAALAAVLAGTLLAAGSTAGAAPGSAAGGSARAGSLVGTTRVLAISIDGLNPNAIRQLGHQGAPSFYRLIDEGASTLNARTELEQTVTLPNHAGMMTGRRIAKARGGHGVTWDDDRTGMTVQKAAGHPVASVFDVVHRAGLGTALFSTKKKFGLYNRSWNGAIDRFRVDERQADLMRSARADLVDHDRAFTFLHMSLPDLTGHRYGFMSDRYVAAVARTDVLLGRVLATIEGDPVLSRDLVVILTADHGGKGAGHSDRTLLANYRIPFVAWGPGVAARNLYDLNADYAEPGRSRPTYAGAQPVRNADVANLATDLLGLGAVPGSELDADQDLDVR